LERSVKGARVLTERSNNAVASYVPFVDPGQTAAA